MLSEIYVECMENSNSLIIENSSILNLHSLENIVFDLVDDLSVLIVRLYD
jgi:hypothetical protein